MKSYRFLLIVFLTLVLIVAASCEKDDDEVVDNIIVGTREHVTSMEGFSMTLTMTFNANLTGTSKMVIVIGEVTESESTNFTYSTNESTLILTEGGETVRLKYFISGNKLTLIEDGEEIEFTKK